MLYLTFNVCCLMYGDNVKWIFELNNGFCKLHSWYCTFLCSWPLRDVPLSMNHSRDVFSALVCTKTVHLLGFSMETQNLAWWKTCLFRRKQLPIIRLDNCPTICCWPSVISYWVTKKWIKKRVEWGDSIFLSIVSHTVTPPLKLYYRTVSLLIKHVNRSDFTYCFPKLSLCWAEGGISSQAVRCGMDCCVCTK